MSSNGISLGDVLNLKFSDLLNANKIPSKKHKSFLDLKSIDALMNNVPIWHIQRMKSGTSHITFNTLEALVKKPADPLARVMAYTLSEMDILKEISPNERKNFVYGETMVHCHHCILNMINRFLYSIEDYKYSIAPY